MKAEDQKINALLSLLQDDDPKVASLAMEQFLKLEQAADRTIAENQDTHDPRLRHRIHQLSSIMARRRLRQGFVAAVAQEELTLWEGICQINVLYDPQCSRQQVDENVELLTSELAGDTVTTAGLAALMRQNEYSVPGEDLLDVELYLIESVLETKYGSPALLCVLAQQVGQTGGWASTIVLHEGRFCLMDSSNLLIDPSLGWNLVRMKREDRVHPCGRKDVWLGVLTRLFMVALIEGDLRDVYHFGDLLTALNGGDTDELPYPLGDLE